MKILQRFLGEGRWYWIHDFAATFGVNDSPIYMASCSQLVWVLLLVTGSKPIIDSYIRKLQPRANIYKSQQTRGEEESKKVSKKFTFLNFDGPLYRALPQNLRKFSLQPRSKRTPPHSTHHGATEPSSWSCNVKCWRQDGSNISTYSLTSRTGSTSENYPEFSIYFYLVGGFVDTLLVNNTTL